MSDPYRTEALAVVEPERAFCPWCAHADGRRCSTPEQRSPSGWMPWADDINTDGRCSSYKPSRWTRIMRRFGWGREPMARKPKPPLAATRPAPKPRSGRRSA